MSRREKLEELLAKDPDDPFLHYALANEDINDGDNDAGIKRLLGLIDRSPDYVAAYFRMGQVYASLDRTGAARDSLKSGIEMARRTGDEHAVGEMSELLQTLPEK